MRKVLISLAAAAATLAVAAPASAQWSNPAPGYGYGYGYGYNAPYGYNNNYGNDYGQVRAFQYRVDALQRQISMMHRRNMLSERGARRLRLEATHVQRVLQRFAQYGLDPYEVRSMQVRIAQVERDLRSEAADGNRRWGRDYGYGNGDWDRDSDRDYDRDDDRDWDRDRD